MGRAGLRELRVLGMCLTGVFLQSCISPNATLSFSPIAAENSQGNSSNSNSFFMSGPATVTVGGCQAYVLNSESAGGALLVASSPLTISLGTSGGGSLYTDAGCGTPATSTILPTGSSATTVYFMAATAGNISLQVWATDYLFSSLTVTASTSVGSASKLVFTTEPPSAATSGAYFSIEPIIQVQNSAGSLVSSYYGAITLSAYQDPYCLSPANSGSLNVNTLTPSGGFASSAVQKYNASISSATIYIGASSGSLTPACSSAVNVAVPMIAVAAAPGSACAVSATGYVYCWGDNTYGELGNGNTNDTEGVVSKVLGVGGVGYLSNIMSISGGGSTGGGSNFCAISFAGNVYCWGDNTLMQLGNNSTVPSSVPVEVLGVGGSGFLSNVSALSLGDMEACVISLGNVYCWGDGADGELGDSTSSTSGIPIEVLGVSAGPPLSSVTSIGVGSGVACAVTGGNVYCWGANSAGVLGTNNNPPIAYTPVEVLNVSVSPSLSGIDSVSVGSNTACAISSSANLVYCWGDNGNGQAGINGGSTNLTIPNVVLGVGGSGDLLNITQVSEGVLYSTCAVSNSGASYCWGANGLGGLGDGTQTQRLAPVVVQSSGVAAVTVGNSFGCSLLTSGHVSCWGDNNLGEMGQGFNIGTPSLTPIPVLGEGGVGLL